MVTLIGMGSGKWEALSAQAQQAVRSAGLAFGAKRLLAGLPADCTARQFALYQPADILEILEQTPGQDAAVLYSGDTGFTPVRPVCSRRCGRWASPRGCIRAFPASSCFQRRWADRGRTGSWSRPMAAPATRWPSA